MNAYPFPVQSNDPHYDQFMKRTLGTYLPACMREVTETRPEDPIEYISRWLVRATNTDLYLKERAKYLKELFFTNEAIKASRLEFEAKIQPLKDAAREENETLIQAQIDELEAILHIVEMRGNRPLDNYTKSRLRLLQTVFPNDLRLQEVIFSKVMKTKPSVLVEEANKKTSKEETKDKIMKEIEKEFGEGEDQGEGEGESRVKLDGADSDATPVSSKASRKSRSKSSGSSRRRKSRQDAASHDEEETEDWRVHEGSSRRRRKARKKRGSLDKEETEDTRVQEGSSRRRKGRKKRGSQDKEETEDTRVHEGSSRKRKGRKKRGSLDKEETEGSNVEEADVSSTPSDPEIKKAVWEIREAIEKKQVQLTPTGLIAYVTKDLDVIPPKTPRTKPEHPIDTPELWASSQFRCEVLYDHEVYSRCDVDKDKPFKYTKNFPKMTVEDFLAPVDTISRPPEKKGKKKNADGKSPDEFKSRGAGKSKKDKK